MPLSRKSLSENSTDKYSNCPAIPAQQLSKRLDNIINRYTFDSKRASLPIRVYSNRDKENAMEPNSSGNIQKEPLKYTKRQPARLTQQEPTTTPRRKTLPSLQSVRTQFPSTEEKFLKQNMKSAPFWSNRSSLSYSVYKDDSEDSNHKIRSQSSQQASPQSKQQGSKQKESPRLVPKKSVLGMARKITERKSISASTILTSTPTQSTALSTQSINKKSSSKSSSKSSFSKSSPKASSSNKSIPKLPPKLPPKSSPKPLPQESATKTEECTKRQDKEEGIKKEKNIKLESIKEKFVPYMAIKTELGIVDKRDEIPKHDPRGSLHKYANTLPLTSIMPKVKKDRKEETWDHLFEDSSIRSLPNDLLLLIFEYCKDTETLYSISQVSRHWRRLSLEPSLWRDVSYQLPEFLGQLRILRDNKKIFHLNNLKRTIPLIKKMTIKATREEDEIVDMSRFQPVDISPFTQLQHLHLIDMDLTDIYFIVRKWAHHITILNCENVQVSHMYGDFSMPDFSSMSNLKNLKLQFARRSGFGGVASTFDLATRRIIEYSNSRILPPSLEQLEISNVYNREEYLFRPQDATRVIVNRLALEGNEHGSLMQQLVQEWNNLEGLLLAKYNMLTNLTNLTSLSLDRVNAFTARVWRECLIPCASQLEYLSLSGWAVSTRESPLDLMAKARRLTATAKQQEKIEAVELALSEFICSLSNIKQITLNQFICGQGLVLGVEQLTQNPKRSYCCIVDDEQTPHFVGHYLHLRLYNFKIVIK